jgi:hypothetical protein
MAPRKNGGAAATSPATTEKKSKTKPRLTREKVVLDGDQPDQETDMVRVFGPHPEWVGEEVVLFSGSAADAKAVRDQLANL